MLPGGISFSDKDRENPVRTTDRRRGYPPFVQPGASLPSGKMQLWNPDARQRGATTPPVYPGRSGAEQRTVSRNERVA